MFRVAFPALIGHYAGDHRPRVKIFMRGSVHWQGEACRPSASFAALSTTPKKIPHPVYKCVICICMCMCMCMCASAGGGVCMDLYVGRRVCLVAVD